MSENFGQNVFFLCFFFSKLNLNAGVIIDDLCLWMLSPKVITCDFTSSLREGIQWSTPDGTYVSY